MPPRPKSDQSYGEEHNQEIWPAPGTRRFRSVGRFFKSRPLISLPFKGHRSLNLSTATIDATTLALRSVDPDRHWTLCKVVRDEITKRFLAANQIIWRHQLQSARYRMQEPLPVGTEVGRRTPETIAAAGEG